MANYNVLKSAIRNAVDWDNNDKQISGNDMLAILLSIVNNTVTAGYLFAGVATPSTNPGTPDQNVFYIALQSGTYNNFGGTIINDGEIGLFTWNGTWYYYKYTITKKYGTEIYEYGIPSQSQYWVNGKMYFNRNTKLLRKYSAGAWETVPFIDGAIYVLNERFFRYDETLQDLRPYPTPVIDLAGLSVPQQPVFGNFYYHPATQKIRFYPFTHDGGYIVIDMDANTLYVTDNGRIYYWTGEELKEIHEDIQAEITQLQNTLRPIVETSGFDTIFTIDNAGIRANPSAADFGQQIAFDAGFYVCPYIDYIAGTDIRVRYGSGFGSFGLVFYDENKNPLTGHVFAPENAGQDLIFSHPTAKYFRSSRPGIGPAGSAYFYFSVYGSGSVVFEDDLRPLESKWKGKTILWLGTSIPEGGYPEIVGDMTGAEIINLAKGSSVVRAFQRNGNTLAGVNGQRSFSQTIQEKNTMYGEGFAQYSYESLLVPYLNGTFDAPDLIMLEYGSDSGVESNLAEMPLLNEDCTGTIGPDPLTQSLGINFNRCTYTGAMLFIINTILEYLPMARIAVIGYQNKQRRKQQVEAQYTVADYWQIPMFDSSKLLGWSDRIIPNSVAKFNEKYSPVYTTEQDVTVFQMWCPDDWHPHSNPTINSEGYKQSNYELAKKITAMLNTI